MEKKISFLVLATVLIVLLLFWPVLFFTFSVINFIPIGPFELATFVVIEILLVVFLVVLWEIYKRKYGKS